MNTVEKVRMRILELEELIKETKERLPAHSTKPPVMMDLLALEDEYDTLFKELQVLQSKT